MNTFKIKQIKTHKPKYLKLKIVGILCVLLLVIGFIFALVRSVAMWFDGHQVRFNQVVQVQTQWPITIVNREVVTKEIVTILEKIPAPEDLTSEPEKLIYKYFGIEHYRMAIAVSRCEGLNHPADGFNVNSNGSIDVGYMRVNSVNFKTPGCSLLEVATPEGNISCAYKIWDRADGIEGNGKGSFEPWVGFTNGCALTKYE
jgi:hypothetical protein